MIGVGDSASW